MMNAALDNEIIVYDFGANKPIPKAVYIGLEFIKYVLHKRWLNQENHTRVDRTNNDPIRKDCNLYFESCYKNLDKRTKAKLDYFKLYVVGEIHIRAITASTEHDNDKDSIRLFCACMAKRTSLFLKLSTTCTVICGGEDFADMEAFGKSRREYPAKFLELSNGIFDSNTFRRVFEKLNPSELSSCLINWVSTERTKREVVAIDGKTICSSGNDKHKAYHVVSAFAAESQLTLGELTVEEKTNEITAVPELLDLIDCEGDIVTADAINDRRKDNREKGGLYD